MRLPGVWVAVTVPWALAACATSPPPPAGDPIGAVRAQAASELSCPAHLLRVAPLGAERFGPEQRPRYVDVEGCSLHVIYVANDAGYALTPKQAPPVHAPDHVDVR